ncbi:MAG: hypothetical protein LBD02_05150, partial [Christensenellaceae bacterium]|nr:hypothetical protein [Christensenellaceae bacterium]
QCPDEASFEAAWAEFTARLAALPLREYEELATQMIKDSVPLYQHQGRQNAPAIPKGKRPELGSGRFPSAF